MGTVGGDRGGVDAARPTRRLGRVPALDGLRGIAILLVLVYHTGFLITGPVGVRLLDNLIDGGHVGVDLFFVLSGFLITALLLRESDPDGRVALGSFYGRRALRLLPALAVLLIVYGIYASVTNLGPNPGTSIRWALVYMSNWLAAWHIRHVDVSLAHLWSLAIEEQFYLLWPAVLIVLLALRRNTWIIAGALAAVIAFVAVRRAVLWEPGLVGANVELYFRTDTRIDALLIGALLGWLWAHGLTPRKGLIPAAWVAAIVFPVSMAFARSNQDFIYLGGFDLVALSCAVLILAAVDSRWPGNRVLELSPLRLLGRVSYGLYLWHVPVFVAVNRYASHEPKVVRIFLAWSISGAFTAASWLIVEQPALRLKRKLEVRRDTATVPLD
jgi:peptidoglycan/LPS O-acetylase OafA/YrhL